MRPLTLQLTLIIPPPDAAGDMEMNPIPGVAGEDYPVYNSVPDTGFDCSAQENPGIYTDTEADCQSFYMCTPAGESAAFLCPNGTLH